ncbi:NAD-dependent succinate-semialdehyde dehydrogenase [Micromonospora sp. HNM0581]|uniref:NAD-dependent succinate-semialdehyde dehydrogenase n=1 Tax=Micromonospora sp. HNM0581 TaxID=2716341 RepID=UPI00146F4503|nr:NAD-dependent succinate-semialdehyde dehydrogenase [Micromonospora sp. HNM0581]NLU78507.1 NAD-dependent succinate-semialdehyde dehydrogenase [Micromonospora sp. HNM0581]
MNPAWSSAAPDTSSRSTVDDPVERAVLDHVPCGVFVGGRWRESADGRTFPVEDPATEAILRTVADGTAMDGRAALDAAVAAQTDWAATAPRYRAELLRAAYEQLVARTEEFALLMTLEMGKPLAQARSEVTYGAEFLRWFSEEAVRISGRWGLAPEGASRLVTTKHPVGPTLMITPWNFPLAMGARKMAPALAAGCTMVVKPAAQTPLTMLALADLLTTVGIPPGVVNVVATTRAAEVTAPLFADPRLRKLTFTGSTAVGRHLMRQAAGTLLRTSMELGGDAPFLVFADADLGRAVDAAMLAKMRNMGEACTAANRFLVHESVAEQFAAQLTTRMAAGVVGRGTDAGVTVGPLIDAAARRRVADLVDDARDRGATVLTGGSAIGENGYFYAPTVLTGVPADTTLTRKEIFGPVAPITTFTAESEALTIANDSEYGLAAYLFTRDLSRAVQIAERLDVGMVGINQGMVSSAAAPFGGVKQSGFGREGGPEGIDEYLSLKSISLAV